MRGDRFFQGRKRDRDGNTVWVDVHPRHEVTKGDAAEAVWLLLTIFNGLLVRLRQPGVDGAALPATDTQLIEFGSSCKNATKGRKTRDQPIEDVTVRALLGDHLTIPTLVSRIREYLQTAIEGLPPGHTLGGGGRASLPRYGTGLEPLYRDLEYRLQRQAAFQHTDAAKHCVAVLRSLEKLACADWCEQRQVDVTSWADCVRKASDFQPTK